MKLWVLYSTDGDSGWYNVRIFEDRGKAEAVKEKENDAYARLCLVETEGGEDRR